MLLVCPTCASEYRVDATQMGSEGRLVRCHSCHSQWYVVPQEDPPEPIEIEDPLGGLSAAEFVEQEWQRSLKAGEEGGEALEPQDNEDIVHAATPDPQGEEEPPAPPPKRKPHKVKPVSRSSGAQAGALAVCGILILGVGLWQRNAVVRQVPALAGPIQKLGLSVNIRGLVFEDVTSEIVVDPSGRFLVVQSTIRNIEHKPVPVPPVEVTVRDEASHTIYTWAAEPPKTSLGPEETLSFRTRLASPPAAGKAVQLRFTRASGEVASAKH